ncbi:MAG: glycosyltransferase family 2 protein [Candidatus Riflebacteria bacterium]|nr:glycosyltransferase family 2 protein [Candidatus Riflebacteria bacterium]
MTKPKLSICIATYNRADCIGPTLQSIIAQASNEIEIIILDGASTDATPDVVKRYESSFPGLRYFRMPQKGGVDQDYSKAVDFASGEYCWFMTDDDLLIPGGVDLVVEQLSKNYSLIVVNAEIRNQDFSKLYFSKRLRIEENRIYQPEEFEKFFENTGDHLSFIGSVVIKKDIWDKRKKEPYFGSEFVHVGVIFQAPMPTPIIVLEKPVISIRHGNHQWTPRAFEVFMVKWPKLIWSFQIFCTRSKEAITLRFPMQNKKKLLVARAFGFYSLKEYDSFIRNLKISIFDKKAACLIALFPAVVINALAYFYYVLFRTDSQTVDDIKNSRYFFLKAVKFLKGV